MEVINESVASCHHLKPLMIPCRVQFVPPHQFSIDQVQKHSETALDTQKKKEFLKSFAYFLQVLYKCYTFVI